MQVHLPTPNRFVGSIVLLPEKKHARLEGVPKRPCPSLNCIEAPDRTPMPSDFPFDHQTTFLPGKSRPETHTLVDHNATFLTPIHDSDAWFIGTFTNAELLRELK